MYCWTCLESNKQLLDWLLCGRYGVYEIKPRQCTDADVAPLLNEIFKVVAIEASSQPVSDLDIMSDLSQRVMLIRQV